MTKKQYQNATGILSTQIAITSFVIGTILLIAYLLLLNSSLLQIGIIYLIIAFLVNLIMLVYLIYLWITQKNHQEYFTIKILIMLANIPIAFVYLKIVFLS